MGTGVAAVVGAPVLLAGGLVLGPPWYARKKVRECQEARRWAKLREVLSATHPRDRESRYAALWKACEEIDVGKFNAKFEKAREGWRNSRAIPVPARAITREEVNTTLGTLLESVDAGCKPYGDSESAEAYVQRVAPDNLMMATLLKFLKKSDYSVFKRQDPYALPQRSAGV